MAIAMTHKSNPARAAGLREAALTDVEVAIARDPNTAAHYRRAWDLYRQLGRYNEALAAAQRAVHLAPDRAIAHSELSAAHGCVGDIGAMRAAAEQAIALTPDLATAHFARATALWLMGDFDAAWREYEWRLRLPGTAPAASRPTICRAGMARRCQTDGCCCSPTRAAATSSSSRVTSPGPPRALPGWRCAVPARCGRSSGSSQTSRTWFNNGIRRHAAIASGPSAAFRCSPARGWTAFRHRSLTCARTRRARLDALLPRDHRHVGLIWASNTAHTGDRERSASLARLSPLVAQPGVVLLSLQQGPAQAQVGQYFGRVPLFNLAPELRGFDDTMAGLDALNLLISVDTGVMHPAGVMGRPVWLLLPFAPDWRWPLGRGDTPWYPTVRLFRRSALGDWSSAVTHAANTLDALP